MFHMCRVKMKGKTGVYCRGDGTQKLAGVLYLSGISQATSAVHLSAVLCGLAYVFSPLQNKLCCTVLNPLQLPYLFRFHTG